MADANSRNFGDGMGKGYEGTPEISSVSMNGNKVSAGTFEVKHITRPDTFNPAARLTGSNNPYSVKVGGELRPKKSREYLELASRKGELRGTATATKQRLEKIQEIVGGDILAETEEKMQLADTLIAAIGSIASSEEVEDTDKKIKELVAFCEETEQNIHFSIAEQQEAQEEAIAEAERKTQEAIKQIDLVKKEAATTLKVELLKGEKLRWYNNLDARLNRLDSHFTPNEKQELNEKMDALLWLQKSDEVVAKVERDEVELAEIDSALDLIEKKVEEVEGRVENEKLREIEDKLLAKTLEQTKLSRELGELLSLFEMKKLTAETLLGNPITQPKKGETEALIKGLQDLSDIVKAKSPLEESDLLSYKDKLGELESMKESLEEIIDAENARLEAMQSWHADWPSSIKLEAAKKPNKPGQPGTKGGWKIGPKLLDNQDLWSRVKSEADRIFPVYNKQIRSAKDLGMGDGVLPLIKIKNEIISLLLSEKVGDALITLGKLERTIDEKKFLIEKLSAISAAESKIANTEVLIAQTTNLDQVIVNTFTEKKKEIENLIKVAREKPPTEDASPITDLLKILVEEYTHQVEAATKQVRKENALQIEEFRQLSRVIDDVDYLLKKSGDDMSAEDKEELRKAATSAKRTAAEFTKNVTENRDKLPTLLKALKEKADDLVEKKKKIEIALTEKERKANEKKEAFLLELKKVEDYLGKIKSEAGLLEAEGAGSQKLLDTLEEVNALFTRAKAEKEQKEAKKLLDEVKARLDTLSIILLREMGTAAGIKEEIAKLLTTKNKSEIQIERDTRAAKVLQNKLAAIEKVKSGFREIAPERVVQTQTGPNDNAFISVKNKNTGEWEKITVGEWKRRNAPPVPPGNNANMEERKAAALNELRAIHRQMYERDRDAYKSIYAGRIKDNTVADPLVKQVVQELLAEKVAEVDARARLQVGDIEGKLARHSELFDLISKKQAMDREVEEFHRLEEELRGWNDERLSLLQVPYEEQDRRRREELAQKGAFRDNAYRYNPSEDKGMDWIGFKNRDLSKDELKRFKVASNNRRAEAIAKNLDKIKGVTVDLTGTPLVPGAGRTANLSGNELPIPEGNDVFVQATTPKTGTAESTQVGQNLGGMTRSVMREDAKLERNKGAKEVPNMGISDISTRISQETRERNLGKVATAMKNIGSFAKSWKTWIVATSFAFGVAGTAVAREGAPLTPNTTLEQVVSWRDFIRGLEENKREKMEKFVADLVGPNKLSYEDFIKKHVSALDLSNNKEAKLSAVSAINNQALLTGESKDIYADPEVRSELSSIVVNLQMLHQMIEDHEGKKPSYAKRNYIYGENTLNFKKLFDHIQNLASRNK